MSFLGYNSSPRGIRKRFPTIYLGKLFVANCMLRTSTKGSTSMIKVVRLGILMAIENKTDMTANKAKLDAK